MMNWRVIPRIGACLGLQAEIVGASGTLTRIIGRESWRPKTSRVEPRSFVFRREDLDSGIC